MLAYSCAAPLASHDRSAPELYRPGDPGPAYAPGPL